MKHHWVLSLQDWNVDPHMVLAASGVNWYQEYIDNGYDVAGMIENGSTIIPTNGPNTMHKIRVMVVKLLNMTRGTGVKTFRMDGVLPERCR